MPPTGAAEMQFASAEFPSANWPSGVLPNKRARVFAFCLFPLKTVFIPFYLSFNLKSRFVVFFFHLGYRGRQKIVFGKKYAIPMFNENGFSIRVIFRGA